jgi:prepilin-type N-terminal cleavage/methylation domain-containing protein
MIKIRDWLKKLLQKQKGFTLVELLVAIVILAVGIIGIVTLFPQSYMHVGNAGRLSVMNHLGQQKLDTLKTLSYSDPNLVDGMHPSPGPVERVSYVDSSGKDIYENYTIRWEVRDDQPRVNMKTIIVEVAHQLYDSSNTPLNTSQAMNQKVIHFQTYVTQ